jgi:hypothetical protein
MQLALPKKNFSFLLGNSSGPVYALYLSSLGKEEANSNSSNKPN